MQAAEGNTAPARPPAAGAALAALGRAYGLRELNGRQAKAEGRMVVGYLGNTVPTELCAAAGLASVRVAGRPGEPTPRADAAMERFFPGRVRSIYDRLVGGALDFLDLLVIPRSEESFLQLYYFLFEAKRRNPGLRLPDLHLFDLLQTPGDLTAAYDRDQVRKLLDRLCALAGRTATADDVAAAISEANRHREAIAEANRRRCGEGATISGLAMLRIAGSAEVLPRAAHAALLADILGDPSPPPVGEVRPRLAVKGSPVEWDGLHALIEDLGGQVVFDDHDWGDRLFRLRVDEAGDPLAALAEAYRTQAVSPRSYPQAGLDRAFRDRVAGLGIDGVVFAIEEWDDTLGWDYPGQKRLLDGMGVPSVLLGDQSYDAPDRRAQLAAVSGLLEAIRSGRRPAAAIRARPAAAASLPEAGARTRAERKPPDDVLPATEVARARQREWFEGFRSRVIERGEPYVIATAVSPHEIFHALDVPVVSNAWYSSVIAAKRLSPHYFALMDELGYPPGLPRYDSLPFLATLDGNPGLAPYGGLPKPALLVDRLRGDYTQRIFEQWGAAFGAPVAFLDAPSQTRLVPDWFRHNQRDWEWLYESHRLDFQVAQLRRLIALAEERFGRRFDETAFAGQMHAINRTGELIAEASALIAAARPCPVPLTEQLTNVMACTWHRGTEWAIDQATRYRDDIRRRVEGGAGICADERVRLLWVNNGLWFNTGFYRAFEEEHGAVFVWSMYSNYLSDGYRKYFDDGGALRALAARHISMNEQLHLPPWMGEWVRQQAADFGADGAVMLVPLGDRLSAWGTRLAAIALEEAGIPVLALEASMVDARLWDDAKMRALVADFIVNRIRPRRTEGTP